MVKTQALFSTFFLINPVLILDLVEISFNNISAKGKSFKLKVILNLGLCFLIKLSLGIQI
jgi:hypothetical protein